MNRKLDYHCKETKTGEQSKQKLKNKQIINTYLNEKYHGIKQTNLCKSEISM